MNQHVQTPTADQSAFFDTMTNQTAAGRLRWYGSTRGPGVLVARSGSTQCFIDDRAVGVPAVVRVIAYGQERRFSAEAPSLAALHTAARSQFGTSGPDLGRARAELG